MSGRGSARTVPANVPGRGGANNERSPPRRPPGILPAMDVELPEWMADAWTTRRREGAAAMVRRDFADAFDRLELLEAADRPPEALAPGARPFRPGGGRGRLAVLPAGRHGEAVVRPYRRGGLPARLVERTYLLGKRAFREAEATERLRRRRVPVPVPLAAVQSDARPLGYRAALVTRRVTEADPAPRRLRELAGGGRPLRDALRRMGRSAGRLHAAGGLHADLNAHNFLLPRDGGDAVVLDFDRARVVGGRAPGFLARMNLRRLRRSLAKLGLDAALAAWEAFEEGYGEAAAAGRNCIS